jgi:chromosome segregation ATPase
MPEPLSTTSTNNDCCAPTAKARDKSNSDAVSRSSEIDTKIRQLEGHMDDAKRKLNEDKHILKQLRESYDEQNAIVVLQEQCAKEFDNLQESVSDAASSMQRFNLECPKSLPNDDETAGELLKTVDSICKLHVISVSVFVLY